jgi:hypothetical protein
LSVCLKQTYTIFETTTMLVLTGLQRQPGFLNCLFKSVLAGGGTFRNFVHGLSFAKISGGGRLDWCTFAAVFSRLITSTIRRGFVFIVNTWGLFGFTGMLTGPYQLTLFYRHWVFFSMKIETGILNAADSAFQSLPLI